MPSPTHAMSSSYYLSLLTVLIVLSPLPLQVDTPSDTNTVIIHPMLAPPVKRKDDTEISRERLFEGDILMVVGDKPYKLRSEILTSSGQEANTMGMGDDAEHSHTWPNRTVRYTFGRTLYENYRATFEHTMELWQEHTCIEFQLAPDGEFDHLVYIKSDDLGCSFYVGRKGVPQLVSMSDYCFSLGHAIHEISHAIGLWHEHSRPDRDTYIDVLYDNIIETETDNFGKLCQEKFELVPDVDYDIESIMHYGPYAFSKEDHDPLKETIILGEDAPLNNKHCTNPSACPCDCISGSLLP